MTQDALKKKLVEQFGATNYLHSLDLKHSTFQELPRLFEVSHLAMQIVLSECLALAWAGRIVRQTEMRPCSAGVELDT